MNCACGYLPVAHCLACNQPLCQAHASTAHMYGGEYGPELRWSVRRRTVYRAAWEGFSGVVCQPCRHSAAVRAAEDARLTRTVDDMPEGLLEQLLFVADWTTVEDIDSLPLPQEVVERNDATLTQVLKLVARRLVAAGVPPERRGAGYGWRWLLGIRAKGWVINTRYHSGSEMYRPRSESALLDPNGRILDFSGNEMDLHGPNTDEVTILHSVIGLVRKHKLV